MTKRKAAYLVPALILVVAVTVWLARDKSVLPIEAGEGVSIEFRIYPQDTSNFTVSDRGRTGEIIGAINSLDLREKSEQPDVMSVNFYNFLVRTEDEYISVETDGQIISLNGESWRADASDLLTVLEQTYYDKMSWTIE